MRHERRDVVKELNDLSEKGIDIDDLKKKEIDIEGDLSDTKQNTRSTRPMKRYPHP